MQAFYKMHSLLNKMLASTDDKDRFTDIFCKNVS